MKKLLIGLMILFPLSAGASEVAFSPSGGAEELVLKSIRGADKSILLASYSFTSKEIAGELISASRRGVAIEVVADRSNLTARYEATGVLVSAGIAVRYDGCYKIMHDKFMVIDGVRVETGSFNYTEAASHHNAENVLVIEDAGLARQYGVEWKRLWDESNANGECVK